MTAWVFVIAVCARATPPQEGDPQALTALSSSLQARDPAEQLAALSKLAARYRALGRTSDAIVAQRAAVAKAFAIEGARDEQQQALLLLVEMSVDLGAGAELLDLLESLPEQTRSAEASPALFDLAIAHGATRALDLGYDDAAIALDRIRVEARPGDVAVIDSWERIFLVCRRTGRVEEIATLLSALGMAWPGPYSRASALDELLWSQALAASTALHTARLAGRDHPTERHNARVALELWLARFPRHWRRPEVIALRDALEE